MLLLEMVAEWVLRGRMVPPGVDGIGGKNDVQKRSEHDILLRMLRSARSKCWISCLVQGRRHHNTFTFTSIVTSCCIPLQYTDDVQKNKESSEVLR